MKKTGILIAAAALMLLPCFAACGKLPYEEGTFEAASAVNSVSIEARDRRVEIALADGDRVKLEYYRNEKEYYDITESDGALSVALEYDKEWTDYIGAGGNRDKQVIRVYIPKDGLERLSVSTTGRLARRNIRGRDYAEREQRRYRAPKRCGGQFAHGGGKKRQRKRLDRRFLRRISNGYFRQEREQQHHVQIGRRKTFEDRRQ